MRSIFLVAFGAVMMYAFMPPEPNSYKQGYKAALKINPPSEHLEAVCAGLWVGEQNKRWYERNK